MATCRWRRVGGDVIECITGIHEDDEKNWKCLPADVRETFYIDFGRCSQAAFEDLLLLVWDYIPETAAVIAAHRTYSKCVKLPVTLFFLAHCPTLRVLQDTMNIPHNSVKAYTCILDPTLAALEEALCDHPDKKTVRFPRARHEVRAIMRGFSSRWGVPCVGAVDGSLIPQRKPSSQQAGGDADA